MTITSIQTITAPEAAASDRTLLDVRTRGEYDTAHAPGAVHVPLDELKRDVAAFADALPEKAVMVCASGQRASTAAELLAESGRSDTVVLDGGMQAWLNSGEPVETTGDERWGLERQVRLVAGSIVLTSVLASTQLPRAKWLAGAIGGGLTFSAISNTCGMAAVLSKLPYNAGPGFDREAALEQLRRG